MQLRRLAHAQCTDLVPPERVSRRLAVELAERGVRDDGDAAPKSLTPPQMRALRAMLARVLPTAAEYSIDLAMRLDRMMAHQEGNGWRYEALPTDPEAYHMGLDTLDAIANRRFGQVYADLSHENQDATLQAVADRSWDPLPEGGPLDPAAMALWFEEVRSDAVRHYVAHPAIMARIGYSGFANGGKGGAAFLGFETVGPNEREDWEPRPVGFTQQAGEAK